MSGRRAVVTGSAQGIGKAVASRLADDGERLVLVDLKADKLEETADEHRSRGADVETVQCDLSKSDGVLALAEQLEESPVDILVNVAGIGIMSEFRELSLEQWNRTFDINLVAMFLLCQKIGGAMADRGAGRIVNMASIAGKRGGENLADYCASKAATITLTQSVASAYGKFGVTANAVCPGLVWTPMWEATGAWLANNAPGFAGSGMSNHDAFMASVKATTPLQRPTRVEDIASAVSFLVSPDAELITGQALNVDGGIEVH